MINYHLLGGLVESHEGCRVNRIVKIPMALLKLHTNNRIKLLFISVLVLFAGFYLRSLSTAAEQKPARNDERPNILLIMADDWSWPYAGAYGDSIVHTPGFDMLADQGILFTHAFCPAPSCTPSRLSLLTGQYPHRLNEGANHMSGFSRSYDVFFLSVVLQLLAEELPSFLQYFLAGQGY